MLEFFSKIGDLISMAISFIIQWFTSLIQLMLIVPKSIVAVGEVLALFPPFITIPILALIAFSVLITILNHWG